MTEKGYADEDIKTVCECEVKVIDENFSTFSIMLFLAKKGVGLDPVEKEKAIEVRRKIKACRIGIEPIN